MTITAAREYLASPDLEPELRAELEPIVAAALAGDGAAVAEVEDRFCEPLAFGTGGLRGIMAAGLRRMNKPNIRRTTLALAEVARAHVPPADPHGVRTALVGYDTRLQSDSFALEAARVLAAAGYKVYLGARPLPTPFLCYAMRQLGTACGVIVTASHNPKEYNGYKAYNNLGGQVMAPWDSEVEQAMGRLPLVPPAPPEPAAGAILPIPPGAGGGLPHPGARPAPAAGHVPARPDPLHPVPRHRHRLRARAVPARRAAPADLRRPGHPGRHLPHRPAAQPRGDRRLPGPAGRRPAPGRRSGAVQRSRRRPPRPGGAPRRSLGADDRQRPGRPDPGLPVLGQGPARASW